MKLLLGDCLDKLKELDDNSIDSIVTDPPYGLSFIGKKWDYDVPSVEIWEECMRVLKPGGYLLSFAGSRTYHRMAVRIEDAGFEIRDQIMWIYGSGFPKSHDVGKNIEKRKVGGIKNLKQIGTKHGIKVETGTQGFSYSKEYVPGVSMGGKQIGGQIPVYEITNDYKGWGTALKPAHEPIVMARKPLSGKTVADNVIEWGTGGINIDDSRIETTDNLDRFPANIIFDEEAGKLLDEQYITEVSRFFYCPKTSKSDRNEGTDNNHPTVKPTDLMLYLIRLVTPKGGTTLDPFMGSGSTGKAAIRGGFDFIGIEREKEYLQIAESRINYEINNPYKEEKDKTVEVKSQVIDKLNQFFE
jgi:site-specific DNA-methyltransferase (adenine-specific)